MTYTTLVSTDTLAAHLADPEWAVVDCRFNLRETESGRAAYLEAHIPGALYAHLDEHLSTPHIPGITGRHPLPEVDAMVATLSEWGIGPGVQVVVYDDAAGFYAGRLWWILRWLGHDAVALLDGDWRAWVAEGRPVRSGAETRPPRSFVPRLRPELAADAGEIAQRLDDPALRLLDARTFERYQGLNETLDPVGGHIPGARSAPTAENLRADGHWKSAAELRAHYEALLDGRSPEETILYCGSGVSAVHDLIALEVAGLPGARLYPGSWSDWVTDRERPVATGPEPAGSPAGG